MKTKKWQATVVEKIPGEVLVYECTSLWIAMTIATALNTGSVNTRVLHEYTGVNVVKAKDCLQKFCVVEV